MRLMNIRSFVSLTVIGKIIKESGVISHDDLMGALKKVVSAKRSELLDVNLKALEMGYNYEG